MPKFNLMSYIMPPEDKMFFTLFQNSAEVCKETAVMYDEIMKHGFSQEKKEKLLKFKKKGSIAIRLTLKQLNKSFITPLEREDIQYIVWKLKQKNIGVLITDHNVEETLCITDRAYLLFEGQILFQGKPQELAENEIVRAKYLTNSFVLRMKDFQKIDKEKNAVE